MLTGPRQKFLSDLEGFGIWCAYSLYSYLYLQYVHLFILIPLSISISHAHAHTHSHAPSFFSPCRTSEARHMMSHYHTLRPSTAQLKIRAREGVKAIVILDKSVEGLEAGEHILAPTHQDEEAIAHRRMEIGKERRFRKHRVQKSHIS